MRGASTSISTSGASKVTLPEGSVIRRNEIRSLIEQGLSQKDIAHRLGMSRERVRQLLNRRVPSQTSRRTMEDRGSLLRTNEVASLLGIHTNTVRRWANEGFLKSYRVGKRGDRRFRREDVEGALSSGGH